jgi:protease PrsW
MNLPFSRKPVLSYFVCVIGPIAVIIFFMNAVFLKKETCPFSKAEIEKCMNAGHFEAAETRYKELLQSAPYEIENHRGYINAHFSQPKVKGKNNYRYDTDISAYYNDLSRSPDARLRDLGNYGLGLTSTLLDNYKDAAVFFGRISDRRLPYYNNSYGYCLWKIGDRAGAEACFKREILWGKNRTGAVANLSSLWQEKGEYDSISTLLSNPDYKALVPGKVVRFSFLHRHSYGAYLIRVVHRDLLHNTVEGVCAALIICAIWFFYFIRIDIFEPEKLRFLLLTFGLGILSAIFCTVLYDTYEYFWHFRLSGVWGKDIFYCIFGIGLIEETVKIAPVLILFRFTKQVNESVDLLIYASISALGFAFMENLLYFNMPGLHTISGRAFSAVVMHMGLSSIAIYGLMLGIHKYKKHAIPLFLLTFFIACAIHGIYDFWLTGKGVIQDFSMFSFLILLFLVQVFGRMLNNALNLSVFFSRIKIDRLHVLTGFLSISLSYVLLVQYLIMAAKFGIQNANLSLVQSTWSSWLMIFLIVANLSKFQVEKNRLLPLIEKK